VVVVAGKLEPYGGLSILPTRIIQVEEPTPILQEEVLRQPGVI